MTNDDLTYTTTSDLPGPLMAVFAAMIGIFAVVALFSYIVSAVLTMLLLKKVGHRSPVAGWVPIWNTVALAQIAGIRKPWWWVVVALAGAVLGLFLPFIGWILSLAGMALMVVVLLWVIKGVQAGLGVESLGLGIVVYIVCSPAWMIWMIVLAGRGDYDQFEAVAMGETFPLTKRLAEDRGETFAVFADH